MAEMQQFNIRISEEMRNEFTEFCKRQGMPLTKGFEELLNFVSLYEAGNKVPEREAEIKEFQSYLSKITNKYLAILDSCESAVENAREAIKDELAKKEAEIKKLREELDKERAKSETLQEKLTKAEEQLEKCSEELKQAIDDKETAESDYDAKDKLYSKAIIALGNANDNVAMYKGKLDKIATEYEGVKEELLTTKTALAKAENDANTARNTVIAELTTVHKQELATLQSKLDARTEELLVIKDELAKLQLELANSGAGTAKKTTTRTTKTTKKGEE